MAAHAASLMICGASKSGKPCDRLTALWSRASRVISPKTESANEETRLALRILVMRRAAGK
jgi:hypothetical protein